MTTYLHPKDVKDEAKDETKVPLRKKSTEVLMDTSEAAAPEKKPSMRKRKTHDLSVDEDDKKGEPPAKKAKTETDTKVKKTEEKKEEKKEKPSTSASPRFKCMYWDKCYQKGKEHRKLFVHPGDPDEATAKTGSPNTRASNRPKPLHRLDSVDTVKEAGYTLKRQGSNYECSCASFSGINNMGKPNNQKTCTHLMAYLGEEFERARCDLPEKGKQEKIPQHISVSVLLAHKYQDGVTNPTGWWMSEKLDGVRAFWNGRCFYSRLGNAFYAPAWFTKDLPKDMHLDGELFSGRKQFQTTVKIVKNPDHPDWNKIKYHVFDAPHLAKEPFEKRVKAIQDYFDKSKPSYAKAVEHVKCTGKEMIDKELKRIIALGGEGLMIREPGSKYERTRSKTLLKIKTFHDAEAVVFGYEPSKSNSHLTGALWVRMANGKEFKVGSGLSAKDRRSPPKKGTIITYKFQEYTNSGTPRFPSYVGIRIDMTEPKDAEGVVTEATDD